MKNIQKQTKFCYCLGGKSKLRGGNFPLKALKKTLPILYVDVPSVQQWRGILDCGVFAIAFAVHLAV